MRARPTPLAAVFRGVTAGVAGTGVMTAAQEMSSRLMSSGDGSGGGDGQEPQNPWEHASAPALVAKRIAEGVFQKNVSADLIPFLTNAMHWGYGSTWGGVYGLLHARRPEQPLRHGLAFGAAVWAMSYVQLVPMGLYQPPWKYEAPDIALEVGYHLAYGAGVAIAHRTITRR